MRFGADFEEKLNSILITVQKETYGPNFERTLAIKEIKKAIWEELYRRGEGDGDGKEIVL